MRLADWEIEGNRGPQHRFEIEEKPSCPRQQGWKMRGTDVDERKRKVVPTKLNFISALDNALRQNITALNASEMTFVVGVTSTVSPIDATVL